MIERQEINSYLRGVVDSKSYRLSLKIQNILTFSPHISQPHLADIYIIERPCFLIYQALYCVDLKSALRGTVTMIKTSGSELSRIPMRDSENESHWGPTLKTPDRVKWRIRGWGQMIGSCWGSVPFEIFKLGLSLLSSPPSSGSPCVKFKIPDKWGRSDGVKVKEGWRRYNKSRRR